MTSVPSVTDTLIGVLIFLAIALAAAYIFARWLAVERTVPENEVHLLRKGRELVRTYRPGETYQPNWITHPKGQHIETVSIEIQAHPLGPHIISWRPSADHIEKFLSCVPLAGGGYDYSTPTPIKNLQTLWRTNRNADLYEFAPMYGVEIVKVEPPLDSVPAPSGVVMGLCTCHGDAMALSDEHRKEHVYIVGKTKSGKSTLFLNMALQDIRQGKGVAFLDPHGDTVLRLLDLIPRERAKDVIYLSGDHPQPLSIMEARNEAEAEILQDDIYTLLRGMSDTWGERMDAILTNTLAALFSAKHCSFLDIYNFLADVPFRQTVLSRVENPAIRRFWANYHPPNYPRGSEQPILSRMEKFVTRPTLAAILGSESGIDLYEVMQSGKIFLVNTSRESMGEHTGAVLGGLIVTKFYQTAMRRAAIPENKRRPFYLYIDEFPTYIASPLGSILTQTRKYGLSLTLAHQYLDQASDETRQAISGNVGTKIVFRLGYRDARYLTHELGPYEPEHIINLSTDLHEALVSPVAGASHTYKITTLPPAADTNSYKATILDHQPHHPAPAKPTAPDDEDEFLPSPFPSE